MHIFHTTILALLFICYSCSCKISNYLATDKANYNFVEGDSTMKVYKIDSVNSYYLIYVKRGSLLYKIVSKKESYENCNNIQINFDYTFSLESIWRKPIMMGNINVSPSESPHVSCLYFDDSTRICVERDSINDLYKTKNLRGLCFTGKK